MAEQKNDGADRSSAHPENWPGIPGRSAEHERAPDVPRHDHPPAQVTEEQRELERGEPVKR